MRSQFAFLLIILIICSVGQICRAEQPVIVEQANGSYQVTSTNYQALIGIDGNLHSLRINNNEFLDADTGASFFLDRPVKLAINKAEELTILAAANAYSIRYTFSERAITLVISHPNEKGAAFVVGLNKAIAYVQDISSRLMAAVPVDYQWGNVKVFLATGEFLEMYGGTRIWGVTDNTESRLLWESSNLLPKKEYTLRFSTGIGIPPTPTLAQLSNIRVTLDKGNFIIPAKSPVLINANFENNSNESIESELTLTVTSSDGQEIMRQNKTINCPPHDAILTKFTVNPQDADFYQINCSAKINENISTVETVFGYAISAISLPVNKPDDFSDFWDRLQVEAHEPAIMRLWPLPADPAMPDVLIFEAWVEVGGKRLFSGWLSAPKFRGRYPGLLVLPPERVNFITPNPALAKRGFIVFTPLPTGESVQNRFETIINWGTAGLENGAQFRMRAVMLRYLYSITALSSLTLPAPDEAVSIDPERIGVTGIGLGGGMAMALAALDDRIQAVAPDVPYYCHIENGMMNKGEQTISDRWPYPEIVDYLHLHADDDDRAAVMEQLRYFDIANFAPKVTCPVFMSMGILDDYALPAHVISTYNLLPGPKMVNIYLSGHEGGGVTQWDAKMRWFSQLLGGRGPEMHPMPVVIPNEPPVEVNPLPVPDLIPDDAAGNNGNGIAPPPVPADVDKDK